MNTRKKLKCHSEDKTEVVVEGPTDSNNIKCSFMHPVQNIMYFHFAMKTSAISLRASAHVSKNWPC